MSYVKRLRWLQGNDNQNEDNTMKYKVKTTLLHYRLDEEITEETRDRLVEKGCPKSWFEAIQQVEKGDYFKRASAIYRVMRKSKYDKWDWYVNRVGGNNDMPKEDDLYTGQIVDRKLSTGEIQSALTKEAKRRGLIGNKYESLENNNVVCVGDVKEYHERLDKLWIGESECGGYRGVAYRNGEWAEVEPTIEINGKTIEVEDGTVKISYGDTIEEEMYRNFYAVVDKYDLDVSRNGEQINEQLQQIWDEMPIMVNRD